MLRGHRRSRVVVRVLDGHTVIRRIASGQVVVQALLLGALASTIAGNASADVSSWLTLGGGANQIRQLGFDHTFTPSLRLGTGMGTDPSNKWIVGGLLRTDTMFGSGTDLSLSLRLASHGYVNGQWGVCFDAGPLARLWGNKAYGATTAVILGGPWGLEGGVQVAMGPADVRTYGAFLAIDLARLTVFRRSGKSYWKNTFPAYRTPEEEQH